MIIFSNGTKPSGTKFLEVIVGNEFWEWNDRANKWILVGEIIPHGLWFFSIKVYV